MITSIWRLNTVLVALFLLAFVSTGYGFMSEKKKVVIHIPDEITYVRHYHPKIVYVKQKHHVSGYTSTTSGHGLKSVGSGGEGGHSGGRNPLKLLLSSEIHSTEIKPAGWSNQGLLNQEGFPTNNINNDEFPPLNTFGDNTVSNNNLDQGQYGLPQNEVAGGFFNDGNKDLENDLHQSSSSIGGNNGVTSLGPQLFTNYGGNSGSGNNGFSNVENNFQQELGHNEVNSIGNYGGSLVGQNSGFSEEAIHNVPVNNNGNGWPAGGLAEPSPAGNRPAWPENGQTGGSQTAGSNDWIPISYQPDNSLWWPMNVENWPQNHDSQPLVQNHLNQDVSNQNLGSGTQGSINGNAYTGIQGAIPYTAPYTQIQSSDNYGQLTGSNNGNYQGNSHTLTSSIEIPWTWHNQARPSELVNAGINYNVQNVLGGPEISNNYYNNPSNIQNFGSAGNYQSNGYPMSHANRPNFDSAANYGGYTVAGNAITTNNNAGIGVNHGVFPSNYVNEGSHVGQAPSYGVNNGAYRPAGNHLGSHNHHASHSHNGHSARPNIGSHVTTTGYNQNHHQNQNHGGGFNSHQTGYIKNANNVACIRFKQHKIKVDSYHPCYEPNNEANQESISNVYYNIGSNNNHIDGSYNSVMAHSGGSNSNYGTSNYNHANNGIYPLNSNVHGAGINNHGNGGVKYNGVPLYVNNVNGYGGHSAPVYGPVKNAQINHFHQGYTETINSYSENINNPNNIKNNNYGVSNGAVNNLNYQNNEVGTHIVMGGSALASNGYYGPIANAIGETNQAVNFNTKFTRAKARPIIANGVNSGPYEIPSATPYGTTQNYVPSTSNAPNNYGGYNPSHTGQSASTYYEHNGNTYNPFPSTMNIGFNSHQGISNGPITPGSSHTYGGNIFEISGRIPFGEGGNLQGYSKPPIYGGQTYDAHSSPSTTNLGGFSYVNTDDNNVNLRNNDARNNFGRSGANRVPHSVPPSNYGTQTNNYRSAANGSFADITSEHGNFVSYPTNNNGQSTYRGNSNSFITSVIYDSTTSKPHYSDAPEHRGLPFTTHVGRGPLVADGANGGVVNSGRYTPPPHELNALDEIIQNSNIYKGIGNGIGANPTPNKYSLTSANFGINSNNADRGVQNIPSKAQFVTNADYKKPNTANLDYVAYNPPTKSNAGHVFYNPPTSANQVNVDYNAPASANPGPVYSTPISPTQGNVVYSVPTNPNQGNVVYTAPTSGNQGTVYRVPASANHGNVVYNSPTQGNVIYRAPSTTTNENAEYSIPTNTNHGSLVYSAPINVNNGKNIYSLPNKVNHGKSNAHGVPTSTNHGSVPYSLPNSVNPGTNNVYNVPSSGNQVNVEYVVPSRVNHGTNNAYGPNSGSQNIVYNVPNNVVNKGNNVYGLKKPSSQGKFVNNEPNIGTIVSPVYSVPSSPSSGNNNIYSVPNNGNHASNNVYTEPNSASHAHNIVYNVPNAGNNGNVVYNVPINPGHVNNIAYNVPNSGSQANVIYSVPTSTSHGNRISYSVPKSESHENVAYSVPNSGKHGNSVYRGPSSALLANGAPQTFPSSEIYENPSNYKVANSGNEVYVGPYRLPVPSGDNYRNSSGYSLTSSHHQGSNAALQGLTSSDNRGNNAAYDSFSSSSRTKNPNVANSENQNVHNPYSGTNFVNHANRLLSSDSQRTVAYRVPSVNIEGSNSSGIAQSGSNVNNAYSEPINENAGSSVFTVSNTVNYGNNAYSVSNSVRHINSAFSVETSSANGKGKQGTKSVQEASGSRNHGKGKRRRLKNGHHKVILPDSSSSEKDIISNIHEEAIKFVENYKVPAHGHFGPGERSDRQWNKRQNVRSMNGVYTNRKSRHTGQEGDYAIQNGFNRVNNYTPSEPGNVNLVNGSRIPFNVNRPSNGRNYVHRQLHNLGNSETYATEYDAATRNNYTTNNSYGGYNSRKFRGI